MSKMRFTYQNFPAEATGEVLPLQQTLIIMSSAAAVSTTEDGVSSKGNPIKAVADAIRKDTCRIQRDKPRLIATTPGRRPEPKSLNIHPTTHWFSASDGPGPRKSMNGFIGRRGDGDRVHSPEKHALWFSKDGPSSF